MKHKLIVFKDDHFVKANLGLCVVYLKNLIGLVRRPAGTCKHLI